MRLRFIVLASLYILVLVTVSVNSDLDGEATWPEKIFLGAIGFFQDTMISTARGIENLWRQYFHLVGLREENRRLKIALARSKGQINEMREAGLANQRLRKLLAFKARSENRIIGAQVVGWDPSPWIKTIIIDRGHADGVGRNMPVVLDEGVVGKTVEVTAHYSKVLLIIDYNSSLDALVQRSRVRGVLTGRSEKNCSLQYVLNNEDLARMI